MATDLNSRVTADSLGKERDQINNQGPVRVTGNREVALKRGYFPIADKPSTARYVDATAFTGIMLRSRLKRCSMSALPIRTTRHFVAVGLVKPSHGYEFQLT